MAGVARRLGRGKPNLADALLGAIALRTGAAVAAQNLKDFAAMGVPAENPLATIAAA
jgi:predicted nucleic acid-binding protein